MKKLVSIMAALAAVIVSSNLVAASPALNGPKVFVYNYLVLLPFTNHVGYPTAISNAVNAIYDGDAYGVRPAADIGWVLRPQDLWQPKGASNDNSVYTNYTVWAIGDIVSKDIADTFYPSNVSYGQYSIDGRLNKNEAFTNPDLWYSPSTVGLIRTNGGGAIVAPGYINQTKINRLIVAVCLKFFTATNVSEINTYINGYSRNFTTTATWYFDDGLSRPVHSSRTLYRNLTPYDVGYTLLPRVLTNGVSLSLSMVASPNNTYTLRYVYDKIGSNRWNRVDCETMNGGDTFIFPATNPPGAKFGSWRAFLQ